jgi:hypothetical protein
MPVCRIAAVAFSDETRVVYFNLSPVARLITNVTQMMIVMTQSKISLP